MPEGQGALTGIPREALVPKEGEASESSRLCQTHRQGGAQAHMRDQPADPLVTGESDRSWRSWVSYQGSISADTVNEILAIAMGQ